MDHSDIQTESSGSDTEVESKCFLCFQNFGSSVKLQVHLTTQKHPDLKAIRLRRSEKFRLKFHCTICTATLDHDALFSHSCMTAIVTELNDKISDFSHLGSPFTCVYCSGRQQLSRCHLLIHLIVQHCKRSNDYTCPICGAVFRTTSRIIIEMHAFQVHVPEYLILMRKAMKLSVLTRTPANSPFLCLHQNEKFQVHKLYDKKNCDLSFPNIARFTAHVISQHSLSDIPKQSRSKFRYFCHWCASCFGDDMALRNHIVTTHERDAASRLSVYLRSPDKESSVDASWQPCYICWHKFPNNFYLQAHIVCAHSGPSWRFCGICNREYCKEGESLTAAILWLSMKAHEIHHAKNLKKHTYEYQEECNVDEFEANGKRSGSSLFFSRVKVIDWKAMLERASTESLLTDKWTEIGRQNKQKQDEILFHD